MSTSKIRRLLNNALINELGVVDPDYDFTQYEVKLQGVMPVDKNDEKVVVAHIIPASTESETLGGDHKVFTGLYQMMVRSDTLGNGMLENEIVADKLQSIFYINRRFTDPSSTFTVQIISPLQVGEGKQGPNGIGWWQIPCRFHYRADTN